MIIQNEGACYYAENKHFTIGGVVFAVGGSRYHGRIGIVREIRDGADIGNNDPVICCDFTILSGEDNPAYVPTDSAAMAPGMLEPVAMELPEVSGTLYALCSFYDGNSGTDCDALGISADRALLMRLMLDDVEKRVPLTFTTSVVDGDCARFMYENTNFCDDELYICYTIMPVSVYPAEEGVAA